MSMKLALAAFAIVTMAPRSEMELRPDTFRQCFEKIRPKAGESRWLEVAWLIDLHDARRKAAAEGKPLFIQAAGKANSIGPC